MLQEDGGAASGSNVNPLEALLGGGAGFPPLVDIPPDADDETMVELAIALSLQEHEMGGESSQQAMHGLQVSGKHDRKKGFCGLGLVVFVFFLVIWLG